MTVLMEHPDIGAVVGRLTGPDGHFQSSCRRFPTVARLTVSRGSVLGRMTDRSSNAYTLPDYPVPTDVEAAAAAMMMLRRDVFEKLAGFDASFFMYMEDTDLCYRLRQAGFRTVFVPGAGGVHLWGHATRRYRFRRIIWHHRSVWQYFARRKAPWGNRLLLGPALAANCLLSLAAELCTLRR
jgi:GT2 family glycosyltransferase